ncbi:MAG: TIM barrel protein [Chthoniobacterales bacterium]
MPTLFNPGLVSVTFRQLSVDEIIDTTVAAKLRCIEWGGDIHVPHGDVKTAQLVHKKTANAGLTVASYGSYYRVGESELAGIAFEDVLASASNLGAPVIRVWAGTKASAVTTPEYRDMVEQDATRIANLAQKAGIEVAWEYHVNTLTDTLASTLALLRSIDGKIKTFWQPQTSLSVEENVSSLRTLLPWLRHIHVYHWKNRGERFPLSEGIAEWAPYLKVLREDGTPRPFLLEFVREDSIESLIQDAAALNQWIIEA